ncbi:MAG: DMT family transporter [Pseudomonadota bacterium]
MPEATPRQVRLALLVIWFIPVLWTANYVVARMAPGVIGPYALALGRWLLAAVVLFAFSGGELWQKRSELARTWWQYLVLGFLGMLVCGAWVYLGARSTGAVNIALIYSASPVLIGLGAALWLGERFSKLQATGVVVAMAGVLHVVLKGQWSALGSVQFVPGDAWIVGATFAWAAYALLQKKWPSTLSATARLAACCAGGVILLAPCAMWESTVPGLTQWGTRAWALIAVAGVIPGLGAYWIYGWAQKVIGASRVAVALYLGPLYTAFVAWALLGEAPGLHHAVGAALILPGVFLVSGAGFRKTESAAGISQHTVCK